MLEKFKNIPLDEDTTILFNEQMKFGDLDCVYQIWRFDGILGGSSLIFAIEDVKGITDETIEIDLRESTLLTNKESSITFSFRNKTEYLFVNFNFITESN